MIGHQLLGSGTLGGGEDLSIVPPPVYDGVLAGNPFGTLILAAPNNQGVVFVFRDFCLSATMLQHNTTEELQHMFTGSNVHHFTSISQHYSATMIKCL